MTKSNISQSVFMSFGELAWLLLMALMLVYFYHVTNLKKIIALNSKEIQQYEEAFIKYTDQGDKQKELSAQLGKFISERNELKRENEKLKQKEQENEQLKQNNLDLRADLEKYKSDDEIVTRDNVMLIEDNRNKDCQITLLKNRNTELETMLDTYKKSYVDLIELDKLKEDNKNKDAQIVLLKKECDDLVELLDTYQQNYVALEEVDKLKEELRLCENKDTVVRKELVGLKGELNKVVFIMDRSLSMNIDNRWNKTCDTIETWLRFLNVEKCVFIQFNDSVKTIPGDQDGKQYLIMNDNEREANLALLSKQLRQIQPEGNTDTYEAIAKAVSYDPNMIILFTDGAPRGGFTIGKYDKKQMDKILKLCEMHKDIPVNVIALGDYFDKELCLFLRKLSDNTGGMFVGK